MRRRPTWLLAVSLAAGCASPDGPTHGHLPTGFLSSYAQLAPDPVRPDVFVWRLQGADFDGFDTVVVEQPVMRRRLDDCLPSADERHAMCLALQSAIESALKPRFEVAPTVEAALSGDRRALRLKTALTAALVDRGDDAPEPGHQRAADIPGRFAFECEVLDASNARPLARLVAFDRTQWIPARATTDWSACARDFAAWAADAAWVVQRPEPVPPAGAAEVGEPAPAAEPAPAPGTSDSERTPVST